MHLSGLRPLAARTVSAVFLVGTISPLTLAQDNHDAPAGSNFAAHISEMAQNWLRVGSLNAPVLEQSAAMMRAAMRSDPRDPRYPRLLATPPRN